MQTLNRAAFFMSITLALGAPALADVYSICPSAASEGGFGSDTFSHSGCQETMSIGVDTDYARLLWDSSVANYPPGLTLGNFGGTAANVSFTSDQRNASGCSPCGEVCSEVSTPSSPAGSGSSIAT